MPIDEVKFFCACAKNCIGESAAIQKAGLSQTVLRQIKRGESMHSHDCWIISKYFEC